MDHRQTLKATRELASSHLITSCAALAALFVFIPIGQRIIAAALDGSANSGIDRQLAVAFLLNIAVICSLGADQRTCRRRWQPTRLLDNPPTTTHLSIMLRGWRTDAN